MSPSHPIIIGINKGVWSSYFYIQDQRVVNHTWSNHHMGFNVSPEILNNFVGPNTEVLILRINKSRWLCYMKGMTTHNHED